VCVWCGVCVCVCGVCVSECVCVREKIKRDTKCDFRVKSWQTNSRANGELLQTAKAS